jgi:hypothetical protein
MNTKKPKSRREDVERKRRKFTFWNGGTSIWEMKISFFL